MRKSALNGDGLRHLVDRYDAGIEQLVAELSRLFDFLETNDLMQDAVTVLTADHGEELMDHGSLLFPGSISRRPF
jgi:arylsulfatase A-like enzyme